MTKTVKAIYVIRDNGDGSSSPLYFPSYEAADDYLEGLEDGRYNDCEFFPEGVEVDTFEILENGVLKPTPYGFFEPEENN